MYLQFLGNFIVISGKDSKFLFNLGLDRLQVEVDGGQFVHAGLGFLKDLFNLTLGTESL